MIFDKTIPAITKELTNLKYLTSMWFKRKL